MTKNEERAERVAKHVKAYGKMMDEGCAATNARDFITDILHWLHLNGHDPEMQAEIAVRNFKAERKGAGA